MFHFLLLLLAILQLITQGKQINTIDINMNFTKVLNQLNNIDLQNRQIDHKFLTSNTFQKKYKTKNIKQILNSVHSSQKKSQSETNKILLKQIKHRYFQDIEQDQIEDANIFGYSTYQYFMYFKKNQAKRNRITKRQAEKQTKQNRTIAKNINHDANQNIQHMEFKQTGSFIRPKTAIVPRGTPTRRRVHHKLSLNQVQKAAISQNPLPSHIKQQYFTEQFFDFSPQQNKNLEFQNIRCGSRTGTFYQEFRPQSCLHESKLKKPVDCFNTNNENSTKRHLIFQVTKTRFYQNAKEEGNKNLIKKRKQHLDNNKINEQKMKFSRGISYHFENLTKKVQVMGCEMNENKMSDIKSVVYERQCSRIRSQLFRQKNIMVDKLDNSPKMVIYNQQINKYSNSGIKKSKNKQNERLIQNPVATIKNQSQLINQSSLCSQCPNILIRKQSQITKLLRLSYDLPLIHLMNPLLLHKSQLTDIQFKYDSHYTPLHHNIFDQLIIENINNHCSQVTDFKSKSLQHFNTKSFSKLPKQKPKLYNFSIILCQTLQSIHFQNIELKDLKFIYKNKELNTLPIVDQLLKNHLPSDFVHFIITRSNQNQKNQSQEILVFETFIHNSDIKYFQGRQVQVQYFKYFLKRFITFDQSIQKKDQIKSSVSLILQSEVKTPPEFQEFCKQMKIKNNLNIVALKNLDSREQQINFRCIQISLSKLLNDANETVMMVKKQLFEGYDWRGVSLTKGQKQFRGYHLEHFYI